HRGAASRSPPRGRHAKQPGLLAADAYLRFARIDFDVRVAELLEHLFEGGGIELREVDVDAALAQPRRDGIAGKPGNERAEAHPALHDRNRHADVDVLVAAIVLGGFVDRDADV